MIYFFFLFLLFFVFLSFVSSFRISARTFPRRVRVAYKQRIRESDDSSRNFIIDDNSKDGKKKKAAFCAARIYKIDTRLHDEAGNNKSDAARSGVF